MKTIPYYLLLLLPAFAACRTTEASKVKDAIISDPKDIKPLVCMSGEPAYFFMKDPPQEPKAENYGFSENDENGLPSIIPMAEMMTRLDVCMDGDTPTLKRVLFGMTDKVDAVDVVAGSKIEGLSDVLFGAENAYGKLDIEIPYINYQDRWTGAPKTSDEVLYIKGSAKDNTAIVTVTQKTKVGKLIASGDRFLRFAAAGVFEFGELKQGGCDGSATGEFTLGTATFKWKGRQQTGTSGGAAPLLCSVTIIDNAKELGPRKGFENTLIFPYDGNENYQFDGNHHSVCDSIMFKTADATYNMIASLEGSGGGSCARKLPGSPTPISGGVAYKFTYANNKTVEGKRTDCGHMTRDCSKSGDGGFGTNSKKK